MGIIRKLYAVVGSDAAGVAADGRKSDWNEPYKNLAKRWDSVPSGDSVFETTKTFIELSDAELVAAWEKARQEITTGSEFAHRGWYHTLYSEFMAGKKVMDVGSGFGVDPITFAQKGAKITFVDLVDSNLQVLRRLCRIMGIEAKFHLLDSVDSLKALDSDYDVIMAMGSMHHAPEHVVKPEYQELLRHLKSGGRWLQLAYPKTRWIRDGRPRFSYWGCVTDGPGTPWAEWLDLPKLLGMLGNAPFAVVLCQEFHDSDFIWFDLIYRG